MKADELMIGNYISFLSPISNKHVVDKVHAEYFKDGALINVSPIPLTEKWLLKLGYDCSLGVYEKYITDKFSIQIYFKKDKSIDWIYLVQHHKHGYESLPLPKNIEHVHQLQNLYFALTQEKLTIK